MPAMGRIPVTIGADVKGKLSLTFDIVVIPLAFVSVRISVAIYIVIALIRFEPDRRIEVRRRP